MLALVGPPLFLFDAVIAIAALVAAMGLTSDEPQREWWGRIAALMMMTSLGWVVSLGVVLYGPAVLLGGHLLIKAALASGWIAVTAAGVLRRT